MPMTNCYYWRQDCSECDSSKGTPECFVSCYATCSKHGSYLKDAGCGGCESDYDDVNDQED